LEEKYINPVKPSRFYDIADRRLAEITDPAANSGWGIIKIKL
jgi:hypothetical protein